MRRLFTTEEAARAGMSRARLRWGAKKGKWRRILWGVYGMGGEAPTPLETGIAAVMATGGVASGRVAGALLGLDSVKVTGPDVTVPPGSNGHRRGVRRRVLAPERVIEVAGVRCTDGLQTLVDLAGCPGIDDLVWEQAMESALRLKLVSIEELESYDRRVPGRARMRRVLALRPPGAAPTESLLETLMVQLARTVPGLPPPVRQYDVYDEHGGFVARVDLAWPELGIFIELDGGHHAGQRLHDANRETRVVAATGWLCGRFTWTEVFGAPRTTARRLGRLADQARRRPLRAV